MWRLAGTVLPLALVILLVWLVPPLRGFNGLKDYVPLHTFMETFAIVVAMLVFGMGWNAYSKERAGNLVLLACAFLAVGLIDFAHVLSFPGMPDFVSPSNTEKAINFWLAARLLESTALMAVALLPWKPYASGSTRHALFLGSLALTAFVYWVGLFHQDVLPRTFVPGQGLTAFKIGAEYLIISVHVLTVALLIMRSRKPQPFDVYKLLAATTILIFSELSFTLYSTATDIFNLLGHVYKIIAYALIYKAIFVDSVHEPFKRISHLADRDALTGIFNRRRFQEELAGRLEYALAHGLDGAVLILDVDNFKYINDTFGHGWGDEVLTTMADLLQDQSQGTNVLARLGGDEFAILLPHADAARTKAFAEEILQAVGHRKMVIESQSIGITVSIGIALFPEHGRTAEEMLAHADIAMYKGKEGGRNRICIYAPDEERHARMRSNLTWLVCIREALDLNRFVLHLQPILDLRRNRISQYEVLLRMVGGTGDLIMPGAFLGIAERSGLIRDIDRWVVRRAIRLIAEYRRAGFDLCLEVNLSGKALNDPELLPIIREEFEAGPVNPANLIFEITETATIDNINQAQQFIVALKTLGCRFGLDDFGVGFSSFNYLKHLPVDYLKIDGGFIRDLPYDQVDQHLVKAIVEVAHGLGKKTVAEFVENEGTMLLLREYGVDFAQGYHIGRPHAVVEVLSHVVA